MLLFTMYYDFLSHTVSIASCYSHTVNDWVLSASLFQPLQDTVISLASCGPEFQRRHHLFSRRQGRVAEEDISSTTEDRDESLRETSPSLLPRWFGLQVTLLWVGLLIVHNRLCSRAVVGASGGGGGVRPLFGGVAWGDGERLGGGGGGRVGASRDPLRLQPLVRSVEEDDGQADHERQEGHDRHQRHCRTHVLVNIFSKKENAGVTPYIHHSFGFLDWESMLERPQRRPTKTEVQLREVS